MQCTPPRPTPGRRTRHLLAAAVVATVVAACGDDPTALPPAAAVWVESVSPDLLRPGQEVEVHGENFDPARAGNEVRVHGTVVPVLDASATRLRVELPSWLCLPRGDVPIVVVVNGQESEPVLRPFEPDSVVELAAGELRLLSAPEELCLVLAASGSGAEYLVGAQSTTEVATALTGVRLHGRVPASAAGQMVASEGVRSGAALASDGSGSGGLAPAADRSGGELSGSRTSAKDEERWQRHLREEARLRARERSALPQRHRALPALRSAPEEGDLAAAASPQVAQAPATVPATVAPGDTVEVNVPYIGPDEGRNSCTDGVPIQAVVQEVGARSIWLDDVGNPEGGFTSGDYRTLSREFDDEIYEELTSYFGEPTDIDGNDRVVIVVSQEVNRMARSLGFVVSSDFFPDGCPGANGGEYYYARAPDPQGTVPGPDGASGPAYPRSAALSDAPALLAHEVAHIIQFGRRLQVAGPETLFQAIWLLEGQATFAEEVVGHRYTGFGVGRNHGSSIALREDLPPTGVSWYFSPFRDLGIYFGLGQGGTRTAGAPEECTWLDVEDPSPCASVRIAYGVSWSLLRWLSDHFGDQFSGGERELHRRLIVSPDWGFEALQEVVGADIRELLAAWAAALYADGRVEGDPLLSLPSWNLRDIESEFVAAAHLRPDPRSFADYTSEAQVAAGSTFYQRVSATGAHPGFALSARTMGDGALPDFMQLWVARIR